MDCGDKRRNDNPVSAGAPHLSADEVIRLLGLAPHPEGGHYRETFRDATTTRSGRAASTAIYFLLRAGEISRWHRVDAVEAWHWSPSELATSFTSYGLANPGAPTGR